jgi:hypothetical protein
MSKRISRLALLLVCFGFVVAVALPRLSGLATATRGEPRSEGPTYYVRPDREKLPEGSEVESIKNTVETALQLYEEANLERNRDQLEEYKRRLGEYYSNVPPDGLAYDPMELPTSINTPSLPPEKKGLITPQPPVPDIDPNASELVKHWQMLDRSYELSPGEAMIDWGNDKIEYQKIAVEGERAHVRIDVYLWELWEVTRDGKASQYTMKNGIQYILELARDTNTGRWLITGETFVFIPGFGP